MIYVVWAIQEVAWNVYPSTTASSVAVVLCLGTQVVVPLLDNRWNN
jgi:alpha-1,3-mannosyltransferase